MTRPSKKSLDAEFAILSGLCSLDTETIQAMLRWFPELSERQCIAAILFSVGFSISKIAQHRNVSPKTISETLSCVKDKFEVSSLSDIRCMVLLRYLVRSKDAGSRMLGDL